MQIDIKIKFSEDNAKFHSSREFAKEKGLKDRICHGIMTLMPVSKILGEILPGEGYVIIELNNKFHNPVFPEEEILYFFECTYSNEDIGIKKISIKVKNKSDVLKTSVEAICKKI